MTNHVLRWMKANHQPMTVESYVELAFMGEKSFEDLGPEDRAEILDLIEAGELKVLTPRGRRKQ